MQLACAKKGWYVAIGLKQPRTSMTRGEIDRERRQGIRHVVVRIAIGSRPPLEGESVSRAVRPWCAFCNAETMVAEYSDVDGVSRYRCSRFTRRISLHPAEMQTEYAKKSEKNEAAGARCQGVARGVFISRTGAFARGRPRYQNILDNPFCCVPYDPFPCFTRHGLLGGPMRSDPMRGIRCVAIRKGTIPAARGTRGIMHMNEDGTCTQHA